MAKVQVHNHLLGGGFGRRLEVDGITQAVQIARQVDGPVKVVWTREEDIQHDVYRPFYYDRLTAGLDADGMPIAWSHRVIGSSILARWLPPVFKNGLDGDAVEGAAGPYAFPNVLVDYVRQEPPPGLTTTWWRGVGMTHNAFMVEGFIDELAAAAKKDPVEYRRALLGKAPRARAALDLVAEKAGWSHAGRQRSRGFAHLRFWQLRGAGGRSRRGQGRPSAGPACRLRRGLRTRVNPDTAKAQMQGGAIFGITAALYGAITIKEGRVEQSNFDSYQMLRINEAPSVEVYLIDSEQARGASESQGPRRPRPPSSTRFMPRPVNVCAVCRSIPRNSKLSKGLSSIIGNHAKNFRSREITPRRRLSASLHGRSFRHLMKSRRTADPVVSLSMTQSGPQRGAEGRVGIEINSEVRSNLDARPQ